MLPEWAEWIIGIAAVVGAIAGILALVRTGRHGTRINEIEQKVASSTLPITAGRDQTVNVTVLQPPGTGVILGQDPRAEAARMTTGSSGRAPEESS